MIKVRTLSLLLLSSISHIAASSETPAKAISFRDYYRVYADDISHQLKTGSLILSAENLGDLIDFDAKHVKGLDTISHLSVQNNQLITIPEESIASLPNLDYLDVSNNQLISLPKNLHLLAKVEQFDFTNNKLASPPKIGATMPALTEVWASNNPMPGTTATWKKLLGLGPKSMFYFKLPAQEQAEKHLFSAIQHGNVIEVRQTFNNLLHMQTPDDGNPSPIHIARLRDLNGNNLLHAMVQAYEARRKECELKKTTFLPTNDAYMKIFATLLSCDEKHVEEMLFTLNKENQYVMHALFAIRNGKNQLYKVIHRVLIKQPVKNAMPYTMEGWPERLPGCDTPRPNQS